MNVYPLDSGSSTADQSSYTTNAVTLSPGRLAFLALATRGVSGIGSSASSVVGLGQTWEKVDEIAVTTNQRVALYRCLVQGTSAERLYGDGSYGSGLYGAPTSSSSGSITATYPVAQGIFEWSLFEVDGVATGGNGALAIVQIKKVAATGLTSQTLTLDAPMRTLSRGLLVFTTDVSTTITAEAGWTNIHGLTGSTPTMSMRTASRTDVADSAVGVSWTGSATVAALFVELSPQRGHFQRHSLTGFDHKDVSSALPSIGDVLSWNGTVWAPATISTGVGPHGLFSTTHTDVTTTTSPNTGDTLVWNGSKWAPSPNIDNTAINNHIAASPGAHAATAISLVDSGNHFAGINVETALAEEATARETHVASLHISTAAQLPIVDTANHFVAANTETALAEEAAARETHVANSAIHGGGASSGGFVTSGGPLAAATPTVNGPWFDPNSNVIWVYDNGWLGVEAG